MTDQIFAWDILLPELAGLFDRVWGRPLVGVNRRQKVVTPFAVRALRRCFAVTALFKSGFYAESHALVRVAYEDWVHLAYLLREPGDDRCNAFAQSVRKNDARIYDAFKQLAGVEATSQYFGTPPPEVAPFVGLPRAGTRSILLATMADDVGLRRVHDFAYAYLSARSHPEHRVNDIFDEARPLARPRKFERDAADETLLATWCAWFTARTLILGSREFGSDEEAFCREWLRPLADRCPATLETCVMVEEIRGGDEARGRV